MLIANISDTLVNGLRGFVSEMKDDYVKVKFNDIGKVTIRPFSFSKFDPNLKYDVGCRKQIPLQLSFAITIHKCQGMTLNRLEIDCKGMFEYGQLVVAVSRSVNKKGLRVLNFSRRLILKPPACITNLYSEGLNNIQASDLSCCNQSDFSNITEHDQKLMSRKSDDNSDDDNDVHDDDDDNDELMIQLLESIENKHIQNPLETEFEHHLPPHINVHNILHALKHDVQQTDIQLQENEALDMLMTDQNCVEQFMSYLWDRLKKAFCDTIQSVELVNNKTVNGFYKKFQEIATSEAYRDLVHKKLFPSVMNLSDVHYNVAFKLATFIRKQIIQEHTKSIKDDGNLKLPNTSQKQFSESVAGKGKIRYLGGWCLSSLRRRRMKRIMTNAYNVKKGALVNALTLEKDLLDHVIAISETSILESSVFVETLHETVRKQNARKGLTHITDEAFNFFLCLEQELQKLQTEGNIAIQGKNIGTFLSQKLMLSENLIAQWRNIFQTFESTAIKTEITKHLNILLEDFILKYLKMSVVQLRKDFLQQQKVKKAEATRKQIKMRTQRQTKGMFDFTTIQNDNSPNKEASHKRLQSELLSDKTFLQKFKKEELNRLCEYYKFNPVQSKKKLVVDLGDYILRAEGMNFAKQSNVSTQGSEDNPDTCSRPKRKCQDVRREIVASGSKKKETRKKRTATKKPKQIKWPCGACGGEATENSVGCDNCEKWFHAACVNIDIDDLDSLPEVWFCRTCCSKR
ncbi:uncharacterized protein LOC125650810 [Ostrea edulis]|uniref:uncharacterized protein LOC125650810 n=1 Tax=Ostrea edulis TaxID=37623 RepID=UPI0024AECC7A|nr:uncharacterized protein LOC125650810 [Ostrea edulis]